MFSVGEKVIHCVHGAGVITGEKEMQFTDTPTAYFVIEIFGSRSTLMVPIEKAEERLRPVSKKATLRNLLADDLIRQPDELPKDYKERTRQLEGKIKTGETKEWLEVIRDLTHREEQKTLSSADRQLLDRALELLSGELALVQGIEQEEAKKRLTAILQEPDQPAEQPVESLKWWQALGQKISQSAS